jgi:glutamate/tyrosine decarboxylase-like PLP-dependent enzyme
MCPDSLQKELRKAKSLGRPVALVVSVAGSTELGQIDPVHEIQDVLDDFQHSEGTHLWHHVDAAYGGLFKTCLNGSDLSTLDPRTTSALQALSRVDSITLDPHKLAYVPYACGVFLCRNTRDYCVQSTSAPYIQFTEGKDRGRYTLEGSRPGTGAAATWMAAMTIGLNQEGYGRLLERTLSIRREFEAELTASGLPVRVVPHASGNILALHVAQAGESLAASNTRTRELARAFGPAGDAPFTVSQTSLSLTDYGALLQPFLKTWNSNVDAQDVALLRVCVMNPFINSKELNLSLSTEWVNELRTRLTKQP